MKLKLFVAAAAALASTSASAATLAELASKVEASGWISGSYLYNFNGVDNADGYDGPGGRATDIKTSSFTLNQAVLNLSSIPTEGFGGAVQLMAGEDAYTIVNRSYGENDGDKFALPEAYVTYASGALSVKAGRYGTLAGYEVLSDAANPLLSRALQFPAAEPYFHTGVRAAYKASDAATLYLGVANSAFGGLAQDDNKQKTIEAGISLAPTESLTFAVYDYYGKDGELYTNFLDVVAGLTVSESFSLGLNFDWFSYEDTVDVYGIAGYATFTLSPTVSATLRLESLKAEPEVGDSNTVNAATLALSYKPVSDFRLILEGRYDDSDDEIYAKTSGDGTTATQPTIGLKAIYSFGL